MDMRRFARKGRGFDGRNHSAYSLDYKQQSVKKYEISHAPMQSVEGWILFVTNLHEETTEDDLREACSEYGQVKNVNLNLDRRTGFVKGYALIEYETYNEAFYARENMNDSQLLGVNIKVDWSFVSCKKKLN